MHEWDDRLKGEIQPNIEFTQDLIRSDLICEFAVSPKGDQQRERIVAVMSS